MVTDKLLLPCLPVLLLTFLAKGEFTSPECQAWQNISDHVRDLQPKSMACSVHPTCTGFQCTGSMDVSGQSESVGFSISIIPCTDPVRLEVTVDSAMHPYNLSLTVGRNQESVKTVSLPGLSLKSLSIESNLTVLFGSSLSLDGNQRLTIEVNVSVKIPQLSVQSSVSLIPRTTILYPTCSTGQPTSFGSPSSLPLSRESKELNRTGETCTPLSFEKPCPMNGMKQICITVNNSGLCHCELGSYWNSDQKQCVDVPQKSMPQDASYVPVWIIAVVTVVAVAIIVGIAAVGIHMYRKRQRYGRHQLLAEDDDALIDG